MHNFVFFILSVAKYCTNNTVQARFNSAKCFMQLVLQGVTVQMKSFQSIIPAAVSTLTLRQTLKVPHTLTFYSTNSNTHAHKQTHIKT